MPRLSVIVPVYNVEEYLDDCLESLATQDFGDFEAVCVNDGSTDSSREILARWAAEHEWVRIVDKKNGGLSSARNAGVYEAQGDYVCFLDSDDMLLPNACGRIVRSMDEADVDVLVYGGYALPRDATWQWLEYALTPDAAYYEGFSDELVFSEKARPFAWRTAARRSFLLEGQEGEPVLFDETTRYGEDQIWQFFAYALAGSARVICDRLYEYRVNRTGSLMSNMRMDDTELLLSHIDIMSHVLPEYHRLGILDKCECGMLRWLARFIAHDALMLDTDACAKVLYELGDLMRTYWCAADLRRLPIASPVRSVLLLAVNDGRPNSARRRALLFRLHRYLFWSENVFQKVVRKLRR